MDEAKMIKPVYYDEKYQMGLRLIEMGLELLRQPTPYRAVEDEK